MAASSDLDADVSLAAVGTSAEAPEATAKQRRMFTLRRRRGSSKSSGNVSTPEDLSTRADDGLQTGDPEIDVILPVSKPRKAIGWRMLKVLTAKMLKCGSPTRLYEGYLEQLYLAAGLVQREVELDFQTSLQVWAPAKPHRRPPLLLLHGFGSTATAQWDGQVSELGANFELYIPNLVFFGQSFTTSEKRSMGFQAECVAKLMQHFEVQRYDVVGFSYGAAIAHRLAAKHPKRIRRVVIADEGIMMTQKDLEEMQKALDIDDGYGFWKLPSSANDVRKLEEIAFEKPMSLPNFLYKDVLQAMFSKHQEQWKELIHEYTVDRPCDPSKNAVLEHEVLLIWGQYDFMAPLRFGKQLKLHFGEKCRLAVLRKARHMAHAQHPREFNHLVCDFLLSSDASVHSGKYSTVIADEEDLVSEADSVEQRLWMECTTTTIAVPEDVKEEREAGMGTETGNGTVKEVAVVLTVSDVEQVVLTESTTILEDVKEEPEAETGIEREIGTVERSAGILKRLDGGVNEKVEVEVVMMIKQEYELNDIGENVKDKNEEMLKEVGEKDFVLPEEIVVEGPIEEYGRIVVVNVVDGTEGEKREDVIAALESERSFKNIEEEETKRSEEEPECDASQNARSRVEILCGPVLFNSKTQDGSVYVREIEELELTDIFLEAGRGSGIEGQEVVECCIDTRSDEVKCEADEKVVEAVVIEKKLFETAFSEDVVVIEENDETVLSYVGDHGIDNLVLKNDSMESSSGAEKELGVLLKGERVEVAILDTTIADKGTPVVESDGLNCSRRDRLDDQLMRKAKEREKHRLELERVLERQYGERRSLSFSESDW